MCMRQAALLDHRLRTTEFDPKWNIKRQQDYHKKDELCEGFESEERLSN